MTKHDKVSGLNRRRFLRAGMLATATAPLAAQSALAAASGKGPPARPVPHFELHEITITELQQALKSGKMTSRSITEKYLARIDAVDKHGPAVNSVIEVNPDALAAAEGLDRERQAQGPRGPLHGIPILIKDNIATRDRMQTTAGSLALVGSRPPKEAFVVKRLREAGAVILGKTNLSEWANIRSSHSTSGWSGRGGQTHNPYALDRNPCGSSSGSGVAVAANLCAVAIGTETDGSVVCPANTNGIVGIKPTLGLLSRAGIIPIAHSQDTAGAMARTVADAATLLGALAGIDSDDAATAASGGKGLADYSAFLDHKGLAGVRLGVVRKLAGFHDAVDQLLNDALEELKRQGSTVVDPAEIPTLDQLGDAEDQVLMTELNADLNAYLAKLGGDAPVHTLQDIIDFNNRHAEREMPFFGQDLFLKAQAKGPLDSKDYRDALAKCKTLMQSQGIDAVMDQYKLDALMAPTGGPGWLTDHIDGDHDLGNTSMPPAVAGYPHITVPMGLVWGMPVGISFFGRAWSEPLLIKLAYAYEQATQHRRPPRFLPTAEVKV